MDANEVSDLIQRHAGLIHRVAYTYCKDPTDREDVVQEVAIQVWRSHARFDRRFAETTWLYRIALNVAISFHRRERRHKERRLALDEVAIKVSAPDDRPNEEVERLLAAVDELSDMDRALVLLHLDGNDHATIADVLGVSESNVGTKLGRIKLRLRTSLETKMGGRSQEVRRATR